MQVLRVGDMPGDALAAAAEFHARVVPKIEALTDSLVLVFQPADYTHRGWRLAAIQSLARRFAPLLVNGLESADDVAIAAALAYLERAPGVTGQLLPLDGVGAGEVIQAGS